MAFNERADPDFSLRFRVTGEELATTPIRRPRSPWISMTFLPDFLIFDDGRCTRSMV